MENEKVNRVTTTDDIHGFIKEQLNSSNLVGKNNVETEIIRLGIEQYKINTTMLLSRVGE
jgi:hypothetical protein